MLCLKTRSLHHYMFVCTIGLYTKSFSFKKYKLTHFKLSLNCIAFLPLRKYYAKQRFPYHAAGHGQWLIAQAPHLAKPGILSNIIYILTKNTKKNNKKTSKHVFFQKGMSKQKGAAGGLRQANMGWVTNIDQIFTSINEDWISYSLY